MDFWLQTMNELFDIVSRIKRNEHCEADLKKGLDLINQAEEEPWIPNALQYHYCKMIVLESIQREKYFLDCSDTRAD